MINLGVIVEQSLLYVPMVCAAYGIFSIMRIPALCLESAFVMGAITGVVISEWVSTFVPSFFVIILSCIGAAIGGSLVGIGMGILMQYTAFSPLLSAILTMGIFQGAALFLLGGTSHKVIAHKANAFFLLSAFPGYPALYAVTFIGVVSCFMLYVLCKTQLGMSFVLYGNNPDFCNVYKISTSFVVITGLLIMHACAGISGYSVASVNGFIDTSMGIGIVLTSITALVLGSILQPVFGRSLLIPATGIVLYFVLQHFLLQLGFDMRYFSVVHALVVILFLALFKQKKRILSHDELGI